MYYYGQKADSFRSAINKSLLRPRRHHGDHAAVRGRSRLSSESAWKLNRAVLPQPKLNPFETHWARSRKARLLEPCPRSRPVSMDDLLREFLTETNESLDLVDVELVRFEQDPNNAKILDNIFRLVHTPSREPADSSGCRGSKRFGGDADGQVSRRRRGHRGGRHAYSRDHRPRAHGRIGQSRGRRNYQPADHDRIAGLPGPRTAASPRRSAARRARASVPGNAWSSDSSRSGARLAAAARGSPRATTAGGSRSPRQGRGQARQGRRQPVHPRQRRYAGTAHDHGL